ncbi:MAG: hypothetical protein HPY61_12485 [Methanotrichaceae archaeon]|nr:hypothetical protein [Methanotrichaceae archaeon]
MPGSEIFCPYCETETEHTIIKSGQETLVKCAECETVHPMQREREKLAQIRVIVNRGGTSQPYYITIPAQEMLKVGDELVVDDEERGVVLAKITSIETEKRVQISSAGLIKTAWARAIDDVDLRVSVYRRGLTRSLKASVPGDEVFEVGQMREMEGLKFRIVKIKLRDEGFAQTAAAKDIVRVWGRAQ